VEAHPHSPRAPWAPGPDSALAGLAASFRAAVEAPDVRAARAMITTAADGGVTGGRLYVDVVRPTLAALAGPDGSPTARLAAGIGEAVLADLVRRLPVAEPGAGRRAAVLSCRTVGIEAVDGNLAMDYLEVGGWTVERLNDDGLNPAGPELAHGAVELVVAVIAGPEDALRLASACTELRRLADPPVILLCDFSGRSAAAAAPAALGADAVVRDPDELVRCAAQRLPGPGQRRWGVRLSRSRDTLLMAPTGCLDATSAGRLADVALTRLGSYSCLVLDLGDVAEIKPDGVRALAAWPELLSAGTVQLQLVDDPGSRAMLDRTGVGLPWLAGSVTPEAGATSGG
jgi:hypothetical protein